MKYILIWWILGATHHSGMTTGTAEFGNKTACEVAAKAMTFQGDSYEGKNSMDHSSFAKCFPQE